MSNTTQNAWDFKGVESAKQAEYLVPGFYNMSIESAKFTKSQDATKNPWVEIVFSTKDGRSVKDKFFVTLKAMPRLQYLHEYMFGKKLEKGFESGDQVGNYFEATANAFAKTGKTRGMIIGGKEGTDGKVYASVPYTDFVLPEGMDFEEGAFDEGSASWNRYVQKNKMANAIANSDGPMIDSPGLPTTSSSDDLPF